MSDKEYSLEELNYFRVCYITSNIIRDGLQTVVKQEWDRIHGRRLGMWQDSAKNGQDFFNMESRRSWKKSKRLLNIIQRGNTIEWDCTCFFFALLFSDSFGSLLNPTVASNVDDLRVFRNTFFAHRCEASLLEADFQTNVQLVTNAFTALHLDTKDLQRVINQKSFPTGELKKLREQIRVLEEEIQAEPKSFMLLPPKPSHVVTERNKEVDDIMQMFMDLQDANEDASIVTVYISGNPGCGKSQVARQVGKMFYNKEVADGSQDYTAFVMTLNAESEQSMLDSYSKFACSLGVIEYSLTSITGGDSRLSKKEQISHLKTLVSAKVQNYPTWLLIFDNVDGLWNIRDCWPDAKEWGGCGQVLVTTQDSSNLPFADPLSEHVSLSRGMQKEDALSLLSSICQFSCDDKEGEHLVLESLDYQPLAIACAALYVRYVYDGVGTSVDPGSFTWKSYLKKLEMGKRRSTEKVYERTSKSYPLSMTSAVSLALQKLVQNQVFEQVVQFLALSAQAPIGLDIIVSFVTKQDPDLDEDMIAAEISKCSLLTHFCLDDSPRGLIKVHQVVHDAFKSYVLKECSDNELSLLTQPYIETLAPFAQHDLIQFDLEFHMSSKMMVPHLTLFSDHLKANWAQVIRSDRRSEFKEAFLHFGDICSKHRQFSAAIMYFQSALLICSDDRHNEDEHEVNFVAKTRNSLGVVYLEQGKFRKAKDLHQDSLDLLERHHLPNTTPEIARSLNKLGNVYYSLGQFDKAKDHFEKAMQMRESLYGSENAIVAASLSNLAAVHMALHNTKTAENLFQRSLALRERVYGKVHPHIADSLSNLGIVYSKTGPFKKAIQYHKQALEMRQKLFFPDHVSISDSYNNLGLAYMLADHLQETKHCYESALCIREKTSGKRHSALAGLLSNLGVLYMELGELQKSKDLQYRALKIRLHDEECGFCHYKTGDCVLNLGLVLERCNEVNEAARYYEKAREIYARCFPASHLSYQSGVEALKRVSKPRQTEGFISNDEPGRQVRFDSCHHYLALAADDDLLMEILLNEHE